MARAPIRIALSGCGAVAALYHAPALALLQEEGLLTVAGLFDPDARELEALSRRFRAATRLASFEALLSIQPDLVMIASPPARHAEQARAALTAGCAVFCEKPLTTRLEDARALVDLAGRTGRLLAAGMIRRFLPATRLIAEAVRSATIGTPRRFIGFEGRPFDWPVRSPSYFSRESSGGGVLMDIGVHALDLLCWWFGPCTALSYADDAMGGVEAECRLRLGFGAVEGELRLSRTWRRPNRYEILGDAGRLSWAPDEAERLELKAGASPYSLDGVLRDGGRPAATFHHALVDQLRELCAAVAGEPSQVVQAADTLPALELIERCYAERRLLPMGWLEPEERAAAERLAGMRG